MGNKKQISEETREKMRQSSIKRWDNMSPAQEIAFRKKKSAGMRRYWKRKTRQEKWEIVNKVQISAFSARKRKLGWSEEEIQKAIEEGKAWRGWIK